MWFKMNRLSLLVQNGAKNLTFRRFITNGFNIPGGYRIDLWNSFKVQNLSVDFVGSLSNGPTVSEIKIMKGIQGGESMRLPARLMDG